MGKAGGAQQFIFFSLSHCLTVNDVKSECLLLVDEKPGSLTRLLIPA
jgi:hypothetical protein